MNLRKVRKEKGLKVSDICRQIGCSVSYFYQLEKNERTPSLKTMVAISKALGVSPQALFFEEVI